MTKGVLLIVTQSDGHKIVDSRQEKKSVFNATL